MSVMLTYVPEKRGEVHAERKLSTLSIQEERNTPQVAYARSASVSFSALWEPRREVGKHGQTWLPPGSQAGLDPSPAGGGRAGQVLEVIAGIRDLRRGRPWHARGRTGLARHPQTAFLWEGNS